MKLDWVINGDLGCELGLSLLLLVLSGEGTWKLLEMLSGGMEKMAYEGTKFSFGRVGNSCRGIEGNLNFELCTGGCCLLVLIAKFGDDCCCCNF